MRGGQSLQRLHARPPLRTAARARCLLLRPARTPTARHAACAAGLAAARGHRPDPDPGAPSEAVAEGEFWILILSPFSNPKT
jgi:hypothetical protein